MIFFYFPHLNSCQFKFSFRTIEDELLFPEPPSGSQFLLFFLHFISIPLLFLFIHDNMAGRKMFKLGFYHFCRDFSFSFCSSSVCILSIHNSFKYNSFTDFYIYQEIFYSKNKTQIK